MSFRKCAYMTNKENQSNDRKDVDTDSLPSNSTGEMAYEPVMEPKMLRYKSISSTNHLCQDQSKYIPKEDLNSLRHKDKCRITMASSKMPVSHSKKGNAHFEINTDSINDGTEKRTTCMLRNIPSKYRYNDLIDLLNDNFKYKYDFVYLILNYHDNQNAGYAFINFIGMDEFLSFYTQIHNTKWKSAYSKKLAEVTFANIQGVDEFLRKLRSSAVLQQDKKYWPRFYYTKGEKAGEQINMFAERN